MLFIVFSELLLKDIFNNSMSKKKYTKLHQCTFCNYSSSKVAHVKDHILIHTGERPFKCNICGKDFNQRTNLRNHMFIHTGKRLFKCCHCGKQFAMKGNLTAHNKRHTGEQKKK
ncbi:unnamed protein product [Larinioides sclopetarius]|uniref:C2H2-type domain-containing protein n=1 Tax=Larinioides sclopetarius TaxID=280406 RepID=A0AAV2A7G7_9ARAC